MTDATDFPGEGGPGDTLNASEGTEVPDVSPDADDTVGFPGDGPPGRAHRGQIDGAPEDGESLYEVVDGNAAPDFTQTTE